MNHMQFIHSEVSNYLLSETAGSLNLCKFTSSAPVQFHGSPMQRCEIRMASLRIKGVLDAGMSFYQASAFIYHFYFYIYVLQLSFAFLDVKLPFFN